MKVVFFRIGLMFALAWTATSFFAPRCKAQSEVSPDHFDNTDPWAATASAPHPARPAASAEKGTARARNRQALLVNIPFAFMADRMALPAGEYRVQKSANGSAALLIQRTDKSAEASVSSIAARVNVPQAQSKLVFRRYGGRYFLSNVWTAGSPVGRQLSKPANRPQSLLARNETPDQVTIFASLIQPRP